VRRFLALLVAGLLAASLAAPAAVVAAPPWAKIVQVQPPNGTDDTSNIQKALDKCVQKGPGCTVQLQAGHYLSKQLVEYEFHGTFRGMGEDRTIIQPLPGLAIVPAWADTWGMTGFCQPNLTDCLWPSLITFVDGTIEVSDLAIHVTASCDTATDFGGGLWSAIYFTGQYPIDVSVDRVSVVGSKDSSPNCWFSPYNLGNGVEFAGYLPRSSTWFDEYPISGRWSVRNSTLSTMLWAISPSDEAIENANVTIGGSPGAGNRIEDAGYGIPAETAQNSVFDISYNYASGVTPMMVGDGSRYVPSSPSQYFIHDNTFVTTAPGGSWADGILLVDYPNGASWLQTVGLTPGNPYIRAKIWHNTIRVQNPLNAGIEAWDTVGTVVTGNTITGAGGYDAIGLYGLTKSVISGNNVSDFPAAGAGTMPGLPNLGVAQIWLAPAVPEAPSPAAAHDLVVCASRHDTVLDEGTSNKIVGCTLVTAPALTVAPAAPMVTVPNKFNLKPMRPPLP